MNASAPILRTSTEFPADWPVRTAASFAPFITSGSRGWARYYSETGDLFMRITNLDRSSIYPDLSDRQHVLLPEAEREGLRTGLKAGDILISITADIGIIGYVDERIPLPAYINQHVACLRLPQDQVWPKFVAYYLASAEPQKRFIEMTDVGAKTGINLTTVSKLTFPCPPLPEQQAIAAALSDADGVVAGLERVIAKKRLIKQGAMQDLLTARRRLPGFSGEWQIAALRQLCAQIQDGTHFTPTYVDHGIPFYTVENVTARNFDKCKYVTQEAHNAMAKRCRPTRGDILMTRIGSIGDTYLVDWDHEASIYVSLCLLRPSKSVDARYLYAYSRSSMFVKEVEARSLPNAIPKKINLGDIADVQVSMPVDPKEQGAIAAVLSDMDAEIQTLESRLAKARAVKEGMMQNLLTGRVRLI